jgi:hypothetical protein
LCVNSDFGASLGIQESHPDHIFILTTNRAVMNIDEDASSPQTTKLNFKRHTCKSEMNRSREQCFEDMHREALPNKRARKNISQIKETILLNETGLSSVAVYERALEEARKALIHVSALNRLGNSHYEKHRLDTALNCYKEGHQVLLHSCHPNIMVTLHKIAQIDRDQGDFEAALLEYG